MREIIERKKGSFGDEGRPWKIDALLRYEERRMYDQGRYV